MNWHLHSIVLLLLVAAPPADQLLKPAGFRELSAGEAKAVAVTVPLLVMAATSDDALVRVETRIDHYYVAWMRNDRRVRDGAQDFRLRKSVGSHQLGPVDA